MRVVWLRSRLRAPALLASLRRALSLSLINPQGRGLGIAADAEFDEMQHFVTPRAKAFRSD